MTRIRGSFALLAAAAVAGILAFSAFAHSNAAVSKLVGTVGKNNAYKINLISSNGKLVTTLKSGTYKLVIHDDSAMHNYELDGPHGKSWTFTAVPFIGSRTFTLKLGPGKYKAYCAPHESIMFQHFTVT